MKQSRLATRSFLSVVTACVAGVAVAQTGAKPVQPPITLKVGDMAPPVAGVTWLKGEPLNNLADGKIHVVEFWATWCGPCKAAMPELSRLAQQYKGRVTFTGVDVWEGLTAGKSVDYMPKVKEFVESAHGRMAYNVGADDPSGDMTKTWLTASGQQGIPCTFVIDGGGRIAYIGHPVYLDELLPNVLNHTFDANAFKITSKAEFAKLNDIDRDIEKASKEGDSKKVFELYDESERAIPWAANDVVVERYGLLAVTSPSEAHVYGEKILKRFGNAPDYLCYISRMILGEPVGYFFNKAFGDIKAPDYALALQAAREAQKCSAPSDPIVNMTLAEALFKTGDVAEAARYQSKAVKTIVEDKSLHVPDKMIAEEKSKLESYKAAATKADSSSKGKL